MSFKYEVKDPANGEYVSNGLRFATEAEAEAYGSDLLNRWLAVREGRVTASEDPVTHVWSAEFRGIVSVSSVS